MKKKLYLLCLLVFLISLHTKSQTNPNGYVGILPSMYNVLPSGAFSYSIPIDLPAGAGGLTPKIAVSYNSQNEQGIFGYGFNLNGITAITRIGNDLFHDGFVTPVNFTNQDKLVLDGNRLVVNSGSYLSSNAIYKTENESYSRIETVTDNGEIWFRVVLNNGGVQEFGSTSGSRHTPQGATATYQWWLRKVVDPNGNYFEVEYSKENGMIYPTKIIYSKNNTVSTPGLSVEFTYKISTNQNVSFISGAKLIEGKVATEIAVKSNGTLIRKYTFKYNPNYYTRDILQEVSLEGNNGIKLPPLTFNWESITTESDTINTNLTFNKICIGDFDGNGTSDVAKVNGTILEVLKWENNNFIQIFSSTIPKGVVNVLSPDLNGDGRSDLVLDYNNTESGGLRCRFYQNTGNSLVPKLDTVLSGYSTGNPMQFGDINGDGKSDMVWLGINKINFWEFSEFSNKTFVPKAIYTVFKIGVFNLCDINGDGVSEVYISNNTTPFFLKYNNGSLSKILCNVPAKIKPLSTGDFNGDGLSDLLCYNETTNHNTILINDGVQFKLNAFFGYVPINGSITNSIVDLNGDRADDFYIYEHLPTKKITFYYPKDDRLDNINSVKTHVDSIKLGDFDGDGKTELITTKSQLIKPSLWNNNPKIISINRGDGLTYNVEYSSSSNPNICSHSFNCNYPLQNSFKKRFLVSKITTQNGVGGDNYRTFTYANPKYHINGLGFLSFEKFSVFESATQTLVEEQYAVNNAKYVPLLTERNTYIGGNSVSRETFNYNFFYPNLGTFAVRVKNVNSENYIKGTVVNKSSDYNSNGILIEETINNGGYVTKNKYSNQTGVIVGFYPRTVETSYSLNGNNTKTDYTTITYNSNLSVASKSFNSGTSAGIITSYVYDGFGNITKISETGSSVTKTNKFEYSTDGRLLLKATNALNQTEEYFYNSNLGTLTYQTDINGYRTDYAYDGFGNPISVKTPNGITTTITSSWAINEKGYSVWKKTTATEGSGSVTEWFDTFGRLVYSIHSAPNSKETHKSYTYNEKGELTRETLPEFSAPSTKLVTYSYDTYGRLISKNTLGKTVSFSYSGNSVTETNGGISTTTNYNAIGLPIAASSGNGSVTFQYNGVGQPVSITAEGTTTTYNYNYNSNKVTTTNPNAGTTTVTSNAWGQPTTITDARGLTSQISYDILGRPISKTLPEGNVSYTYDTQVKGALSAVTFNGHTRTFNYNTAKYGRLQGVVDNIEGNTFNWLLNYNDNNYGRLNTIVYPNGFSAIYSYDSNGFCTSIAEENGNTIWSRGSETALGQPLNYTLGNGLQQNYQYNNNAALENIKVDGIYSQSYSFDPATGNLLLRKDNLRQLTETFEYDGAHRLSTINGPLGSQALTYSPNGNITSKYDAGNYYYSATPNAVTEIAPYSNGAVPTLKQSLTYTSFNKPISIAVGTMQDSLAIVYGVDLERVVEKTYKNNVLTETRYVLGGYELVKAPGKPNKHICYINSPFGVIAVNIANGETAGNLHYLHTDHLGSVVAVTNANGALEEEMNYDAWGRRRNPANWEYDGFSAPTIINRGYTFHQHYDQLGLINMNGRVYDPVVARFLGVDPVVANPLSAQDYNGYSYCTNNPLKFTDPSGYTYIEAMRSIYKNEGDSFWYRGEYIVNTDGLLVGSSGRCYGGMGYTYDWSSGTYNYNGQPSSFANVFYNYAVPMAGGYYKTYGKYVGTHQDKLRYDGSVSVWVPQSEGDGIALMEKGPAFDGGFWDWANKINHLGKREWNGKYIDDDGNVIGIAPITGIAPTPALKAAKVGRAIHRLYNPGSNFILNKAIPGTRLRPDAIDPVNKIIRELKPNNPAAIQRGWKQLEMYRNAANDWIEGAWQIFLDLY